MRSKFEKFGLIGAGVFIGILVSLNISAWADKTSVAQLPIDELRVFAEVFAKVKSDYVETVEDKKLINEALSGMLQGLDPHSTFMDADAYKELQAGTQGEFGGLGIEVAMEDGLVKVVTPIEDSPAYKAGLKSGDLIIKLDDAQVRGMSLNDAVKRMRGVPETKIVLTVVRKGEDKPLTFTLTRAIIKAQSVKNKWIEQDYGYVRITQFQERTGEDLAKALKTLSAENKTPLKGLVLDLRNNPGGLLDAAVGVSAAFLPKDDLVVYTEGRVADSKMRLTATPMDYARRGKSDYLKDLPEEFKSVPIVVLINAGSASASEIVAGALQDHKRATIMGIQSFGKGSVQTILPMNNGSAIKLTTARYFTPNGRSIQAKGIVPDMNVDDGSDPSLSLHEADLKRHLSNPNEGKANADKSADDAKAKAAADKLKEEKHAETRGPIEPASKDDFQFMQALNLLKGQPVLKAPEPAKVSAAKP
ncbi:S41 family peptidase [Methylophilus aquaticus]|uniref:S41 family peptidase n=1 Tax=Methylophilus aquaticus TaxID=1971610 RepID=A0ABT9JQ88_9PROT|nr:S41 family peptidase [Methylophilus aquaticus]MDP8566722.1 S41 family peptidase [Methylophilus aquaticus]